jgi:hypothetical protein
VVVEVPHRYPQMLNADLLVLSAAVGVRLPHRRPVVQPGGVPHSSTVTEVHVPERRRAQRPSAAVIDGFDLHRFPLSTPEATSASVNLSTQTAGTVFLH